MRGRSIHARSLLRQLGTHKSTAPALSAAASAISTSSASARGFISSCGPRSTRSSSRRVSSSVLSSSKSSGNASAPGNAGGSSSSGNSGSAASSSSAASKGATADKHMASGTASPLVKVKSNGLRLAKAGVNPANPPPSTLASVAWESFFTNERPLLQHEMLPPRPKRAGGFGSSTSPSGGSLTAIFTTDGSLATFGNFSGESQPQWRRRMRTIAPERFGELIDGLAGIEAETNVAANNGGATRWLVSSFHPESDRVAVESAKLEEEERMREEEEEAVQNALDRGEDPETARKLGAEADLIILGEPHGPSAEWSRGVATYLAEKGRAYEAPAAPVAGEAEGEAIGELEARSVAGPHVANSVFFTDDDPNLMLSHALVQTTLPLALKWDKLVAQMDAVALDDPSRMDAVVDTTKLDAELEPSLGRAGKRVKVSPLLEAHNIMMDSVRRKRRKKIRKHKYKKLRKTQRAERQRMKK
ncbi:uncharacterized protein PAN0_058d6498 [Moesziomyces antarcticus]|uniref:Uncharacterized protein n=2 Tax=Pseudozyma antarctica TaxID=84753 RepID=A0A5C3FSQ0_PSEA2|nr:uncharacterized protein PAN0_058d6498 [Moesziomyces antarcticus]GAK68257.1 conserved hypothetical protein [Moesziomyces antarcticus]SPO47332.1 uncharacterized protein PSANT_05020 [Moesziomyces antarcticus]